MTRRKDSILDDLVNAPWWVSVACAAGAFVVLRFVVLLMIPAGPVNSSNFALK